MVVFFEDGVKAHDDAAFDLINKYVTSEAKFDEKDADAMYDKYLRYAGVEKAEPADAPTVADGAPEEQPAQQQNEAAAREPTEVQEAPPTKSSAEHAGEMEAEATKPDTPTKAARLIGEWEKQTGNSVKDVEEHYRQKSGAKPTWIKDDLGKTEYYEKRAQDFEERNPGKEAPDYYREYGDKYVKRFDKLKPELSKEGQEWMERTKDRLQFKMEAGLLSGEWDESKPEELKEKAYDSHSEAYLEAGLADLPQEDIEKIVGVVDRLDMTNGAALKESLQVLKETGVSEQSWGAVKAGIKKVAAPNPEAYDETEEALDTNPYVPRKKK
ncbi:hypothetical protein [Pseudodesulfovibrio piezophilus]|uniref:Uncharacterized protein n=1 Tax=Pseudodesulfovibrio piezophilus (strain DSM 21447 / JCM 15486 / C1TLV30) TaxID=1322246 RepID=M1WPP8_PSEP2|nr:hypothetical protein [Pseudodesulfovibrio piezophilus]CCH48504.1 protein of unknown function [Pseudodesulfovibrio piezophilus C1TLV30]